MECDCGTWAKTVRTDLKLAILIRRADSQALVSTRLGCQPNLQDDGVQLESEIPFWVP